MNGLRVALLLAVRQLAARWKLNGSAVLGIALGVLVLIAMTGVMQGFQQEFLSQILRVAPHARVVPDPVSDPSVIANEGRAMALDVANERASDESRRIDDPMGVADRLMAHPDVLAACPGIEGRTVIAVGAVTEGALLLGVDPIAQDACTPLSRYVTDGEWAALARGRSMCALGDGLAAELDVGVGDRVRIATAGGSSETLTVGAIVDTDVPALDDVRVYLPLRTAQTALGRPDEIGHIDLRLRDPLGADLLAPELEALADRRVEDWQTANANMLSLFRLQNAIVTLVIVAILLVGGFGILAIQVMLVLQKRRDIAILRAIGLQRADIVVSFLVQGALIAFVGAVLGDVAGAFLLDGLRLLPVQSGGQIVEAGGFLIHEDPVVYVWGLVFGSLVGTVASVVPATRAASVEAVDVLRGQVA